MKIRNRTLLRCAAWAGTQMLRVWMKSVRYRYQPLGPNLDPNRPEIAGRYIYAFWHENMLLPAVKFGRPDVHVLISQHRDGQLITDVITKLGFSVVRGSAGRKGAVESLRQMMKLAESDHIAITPDGPRGPRRIAQAGMIYLASKTGLPIVPMGIGFGRAWRAKSWDRFAIPKPFTRGYLITGEPMVIARNLEADALEPERLRVQAELDRLARIAESWAATGRLQSDEPPPARLAEAA